MGVVAKVGEKTQSLEKRKPRNWETQYGNRMSMWIIKSPKITIKLVFEIVTEGQMMKSSSNARGVTESADDCSKNE